jgi:hypothetical protein
MEPDLSLLETLKGKLLHAKDFNEVSTFFFDHFGDHPAFIALGERVEDDFLESILLQVGTQLFPGPIVLERLLLTRLAEQGFVHGGFTLNGRLGSIIYFEDVRVGLIAVVLSVSPSETRLARFTGKPLPKSWLRSNN